MVRIFGSLGLGLFALTIAFGFLGRLDAALVVGGLAFLLGGFAIGLIKPMMKLAIIGGALILAGQTLGWFR